MGIITLNACPVCGSTAVAKTLEAKDYTVSQQLFEIWQCAACTLRFTQHIPDRTAVGAYYQSDAYISHTDTSQGLVNKLYHFVRRTTLQKKVRLVQKTTGVKKGSLLDIGAGIGAFAAAAQLAGWQVTGLEPDAATRQRAAAVHNIALQDTDTLSSLPAASFDAITMWHVLEHVHELHACMEQVKTLLKDNGRALIAVPNYTSRDAGFYQQYWAAYDVPRHLYHFSPAAMAALLKQHKLQLHKLLPMWYDSFYISMLSEQYKYGTNNLVRAAYEGMLSNGAALLNPGRCSSLVYVIGK